MTTGKWINLRQLGKQKYSLLYGSLFWGCICATACIIPLILIAKVNGIMPVIIDYAVWIFGGYFYGSYVWEKQEKKSKTNSQ